MGGCWGLGLESLAEPRLCASLQVNREIVSGMKYIQHTYRKGVKSECGGTRREVATGGSRGAGRERGKARLSSLTDALPVPRS